MLIDERRRQGRTRFASVSHCSTDDMVSKVDPDLAKVEPDLANHTDDMVIQVEP